MKPLGPSDPRHIGPYRLFAELGRGGMGRVLLAGGRDGRLVALKLVHAQHVEDPGFLERFRREVEASRRVSGAYTAAVVDAGAEGEVPWLATVFVPGPTLKDAVDAGGPLPVAAGLRLAAGLASALGEIHGAGLVHRDLKPSNVLLAADGPRVIDFGVARATDGGTSELTHTGWLVGSPGYMSPEQAESKALTAASDIFSLGAVLYLACTGVDPFMGASTPATLYNVVHGAPDLELVPEPIRGIVEACIAKDPAARPTPGEVSARVGTVPAAARAWPEPVYQLIAHQDEAVAVALRAGEPDPWGASQDTLVVDRLPAVPPTRSARIAPDSERTEAATPYPTVVGETSERGFEPGFRRRLTIALAMAGAATAAIAGAAVLILNGGGSGAPVANPPAALDVSSSDDTATSDSPPATSSGEDTTSSSPEPSTSGSPSGEPSSSSEQQAPPSTSKARPACLSSGQAQDLAGQLNGGLPSDAKIGSISCDNGWATAVLKSASVGNAKVVYAYQDGAWKAVDLGSDVCAGPISAAPADIRRSANC